MNRDYKMEKLGDCGERIVANYLSEQGKVIKLSTDRFDSKKDFLADNKTVEVKTQVPFISKKSFSIRPNQLKKCKQADELYFVDISAPAHKSKWDNKVYKVDTKTFKYINHVTNDSRQMILIPIEQPAVSFLTDISEEDIEQLSKLTVSDY